MFWLGIALVAMLSMIYLTPEIEGLSAKGKVALGVGIFAIISWITQALDDAQSGFLIIAFLVLFGAGKIGEALVGYSSTGVWIVMLGMVMAACMGDSGLSKRLALIIVSKIGKSAINLYWAISLVTLIMTFFIPSLAAKTLLVLPIITSMGLAFGAEKGKSTLVKGLIYIVTVAGTMYCMGIMTSHAANPISVSLLKNATGVEVSWMEWFKIGMPPAILMGLIATYIIIKMFPPDIEDISAGRVVMNQQLTDMGKMSSKEIYAFVIFIATLLLWATDKLHGLNTTLVAMLAVAAMIAPVPTQVMTWKEAEKKVPWNVFIVYGAGLSMGSLLVKTGAAKWLASTFFHPLLTLDVRLQVVIFIWLMLALQVLFTGAGPKTTALTPVVIAHAVAVAALPANASMQVTAFVLLVAMNMLHQYLLPVSNLPNIISLATEEITSSELIKVGAIMSLFGAVFSTIMVYTYWSWIGLF
ncbi:MULTISPECIES: DASS family sodium-coupled anion symporter [unclassified Sulfurospirillum]|nr:MULTISPECIES: DASS family sodium-coupled anion symporter [unclassified Sulfurospirillum]